jgi:5-methyltetrahydrofolate--homocysteine methyltransferase
MGDLLMDIKSEIYQSLIRGDIANTVENVKKALEIGESPNLILDQSLLVGMNYVGEKFKINHMFIPEVLASATAMNQSIELLRPYWDMDEAKKTGKVVIGTVSGDVHDIGKNIVIMMLEAARFDVVDLGVDVSVERFVKSVKKEKPDVLGLSALLTTTMPMLKTTIQAIKDAGYFVKTVIGGAQVNSEQVEISGASAYAPNAVVGVEVITKLVAEKKKSGS